MITLDVTVDDQSGIAGAITGLRQQLPFALSLGLNNTADAAQRAIQNKLPDEFHLRQASFIANTIYRKPGQDFATKTNLAATVRVNPARDFLSKFEDGGEKTSISGKTLPVPIFRQDSPNIIVGKGSPLNIAALMSAIAGGAYTFTRRKGSKVRGRAVNPQKVFLVHNDKGTFILERVGAGPDGNEVLYWFKKSVPIPASLNFEATAETAALAAWDDEFSRAIDYAIMTAK